MSFFGKKKENKSFLENTKNEKVKPLDYEKAKEEYLDEHMRLVKVIHTWKSISFLSMILNIFCVIVVGYLSTRSSLIPYVIEVDSTGNAKGINPAYQMNYEPKEENIKYYLRDFVTNSRWLSSDQVLQGTFYKKSLSYLTNETMDKFNELVQKENWSEMIRNGYTRDVQIESINKIVGTDNSYQLRWIETAYNKGSFVTQRKMSGIYSIKIETPKELSDLELNPLGIKIQDYHVTGEK